MCTLTLMRINTALVYNCAIIFIHAITKLTLYIINYKFLDFSTNVMHFLWVDMSTKVRHRTADVSL